MDFTMSLSMQPKNQHFPKPSTRGYSFQVVSQEQKAAPKKRHKSWLYCPFHLSLFISCCLRMCSFSFKKLLQWADNNQNNHDPIRSGVSASMDNNAVCTLPIQLSSRSRKDLICGIPRTLGCTQVT